MTDIDDTIRTLTEQVEGLQADMEQLRGANEAWSKCANDHDLDDLREFLNDHDLDEVTNLLDTHDIDFLTDAAEFASRHDIEEIANALRWVDIDDLTRAHNRMEEYGDPEELAEKIEDLEEQLAQATAPVPDSGPPTVKLQDELAGQLDDYKRALDRTIYERDNLTAQLAARNERDALALTVVSLFTDLAFAVKRLEDN